MNEKLTSIFGGWWAISGVIEVQALLFSSNLQLVSCSVRSCQRVGKRNKNGNWSIWLFDSRPDERPGWKMLRLWAKLQFCLLPRICQEPTDAHGDSRPSSLSWRKKKIFHLDSGPSSRIMQIDFQRRKRLSAGHSSAETSLVSREQADVAARWRMHRQESQSNNHYSFSSPLIQQSHRHS